MKPFSFILNIFFFNPSNEKSSPWWWLYYSSFRSSVLSSSQSGVKHCRASIKNWSFKEEIWGQELKNLMGGWRDEGEVESLMNSPKNTLDFFLLFFKEAADCKAALRPVSLSNERETTRLIILPPIFITVPSVISLPPSLSPGLKLSAALRWQMKTNYTNCSLNLTADLPLSSRTHTDNPVGLGNYSLL